MNPWQFPIVRILLAEVNTDNKTYLLLDFISLCKEAPSIFLNPYSESSKRLAAK